VRPRGDADADARALRAIHLADPGAIVTGYPYLEKELEQSLDHDLPRVGLVALLLVAVALRAVLGRGRDVVLALATIAAEIACVTLAMRALHLRWHVYDALVLPVLIGVTIDESMFLLGAARAAETTLPPGGNGDVVAAALRAQGPLVASTALTTAAGFAALLACRFDGLADLGAVGTLGVLIGLVAALVIVPAGLRLRADRGSSTSGA
jgi:predicted RND superfamily exporter protein